MKNTALFLTLGLVSSAMILSCSDSSSDDKQPEQKNPENTEQPANPPTAQNEPTEPAPEAAPAPETAAPAEGSVSVEAEGSASPAPEGSPVAEIVTTTTVEVDQPASPSASGDADLVASVPGGSATLDATASPAPDASPGTAPEAPMSAMPKELQSPFAYVNADNRNVFGIYSPFTGKFVAMTCPSIEDFKNVESNKAGSSATSMDELVKAVSPCILDVQYVFNNTSLPEALTDLEEKVDKTKKLSAQQPVLEVRNPRVMWAMANDPWIEIRKIFVDELKDIAKHSDSHQ